MSFTLCHAAGNMFMGRARRRAGINFADTHGDVFTVSESRKDKAALRARPNSDVLIVGELAIGWDTDKFTRDATGRRQVMRGGKRGALRAGSRDHRRRGPSRAVAWVLLTEVATSQRVIIATHHAIAKADTKHKWRRPLRRQGFRGVVAELNEASARFPDADVILTGDFNTIGGILAFVRGGLVRVGRLRTFGRLAYDRIYKRGCRIAKLRRARTRGDHKALIGTVYLTGDE